MRYIDSGSRDPKEALGTWLGGELLGSASPSALRVQTGFFGSDSLGYFEDALAALSQSGGHTRFLVGSNDGQTPRAAVANLLAVAGQPRSGLRIGVVSFQSGYFHPKVFHIQRADGSSTAYVGSANLTGPGTTSLHVEAGLIVDTNAGDSTAVLDSIAYAVDEWFTSSRQGLYEVADDADLGPLVTAGVLGVVPPPRPARSTQPAKSGDTVIPRPHSLKPLVAAPSVRTSLPSEFSLRPGGPSGGGQQTTPAPKPTPTPPSTQATAKHWGKVLSKSDAQRKPTGNQRGAITLVQGDYKRQIDQTTYFREDLFGQQSWVSGTARTGQAIEVATIPMNVTIDGIYHGTMDFEVTNGSSRESSQKNYTAELHIEPIGPIIRQTDISGMHLNISLDANGEYWLTIE